MEDSGNVRRRERSGLARGFAVLAVAGMFVLLPSGTLAWSVEEFRRANQERGSRDTSQP